MASVSELVGLAIDLVVNEPWDLTSSDGSVRFAGIIAKAVTFASGADDERLLIRLLKEAEWRGNSYGSFVASHRHNHGFADDLLRGYPVECSLVAVSEEAVLSSDPVDTSDWRGGLAIRATIERSAPLGEEARFRRSGDDDGGRETRRRP